jgi:hypothetical protein
MHSPSAAAGPAASAILVNRTGVDVNVPRLDPQGQEKL